MTVQTLQHWSAKRFESKPLLPTIKNRSSVLERLAHLRAGLFRDFESISLTMFITGLLQRQGRLMLHLVCLRHRDSYRCRLYSQSTLLPTVTRFSLRMHHFPLLAVKRVVGTVVLKIVMP